MEFQWFAGSHDWQNTDPVLTTAPYQNAKEIPDQYCQDTASRRPIAIRISADYSIFENGASDGHENSVLQLFELCRPSYRGLYVKFS